MIYIIGDSHVSVFSGTDKTHDGLMHIQPEFGTCYTLSQGQLRSVINRFEQRIPHFCPIKVGSHTAYNSFEKITKIEQAIEEYKVNENDYIFLCFGQIDVQNHLIPNSIKNNNTIVETIQICVDRYIKTLTYLKEKYSNIKIGAYAAVATSIGCGYNPKISKSDSIKYNEITLLFNEYLKLKCEENGLLFKDISKQMLLEDGSTDNKYVIDDIHLSQNAMELINKEFEDIIWETNKI